MSMLNNFIKDEINNCLGIVLQTVVEHFLKKGSNETPNEVHPDINDHLDLATENIMNKIKEHPNWREENEIN